MTSIELLTHQQELLRLEKEEDLKTYQKLVLSRSLKERIEKGVSWYPLRLIRFYIGLGERIYVELALSEKQIAKPGVFQTGSVVSLFGTLSDQEVGRLSGVVASIRPNSTKIALSTDQIPDWLNYGKIGLDLGFDDKTYQLMNAALVDAIGAEKDQRLKELREILLGEREPEFFKWEVNFQNPNLNESQNRAVQKALEARDVAIIHGPPGTGKTTTLVQTIREVTLRENQVLVCAPSNTAVDLLTIKCQQEGLSVLRIGNPARVDDSLLSLTLDGRMEDHPDFASLRKIRKDAEKIRRQALKHKRKFGQVERNHRQQLLKEARELKKIAHKLEDYILHQVIDKSQVITATLTGSANRVLEGKKFHTVFIDEAAQALAPACWIAMQRADRIIMAGDHYQLPPTVKSFEADRQGLSQTLFEHVIQHKKVDVMLELQYRMNHQIMTFSGAQFYNGVLKADASVRDHLLAQGISPVEYIDTAGCGFDEKQNPETLSTANKEEGHLLLKHLALLINQLENQQEGLLEGKLSIGIISPYKAQVKSLQKQLLNSPMLAAYESVININTVDGFQGQERDIIYISLVRSNSKGEIGFLKDIRRMNVALTRARKKLVVIGDSATIGQHAFYASFLDYVEKIGAYRSAWEIIGVE